MNSPLLTSRSSPWTGWTASSGVGSLSTLAEMTWAGWDRLQIFIFIFHFVICTCSKKSSGRRWWQFENGERGGTCRVWGGCQGQLDFFNFKCCKLASPVGLALLMIITIETCAKWEETTRKGILTKNWDETVFMMLTISLLSLCPKCHNYIMQ